MRRYGFDEESYFTFSYSAIRDESGGVLQVTCIETTDRVLSERRLQALRALSAQAGDAKTVVAACEAAIRTVTPAASDLPFTAMYLLDAEVRRATLVAAAHLQAGSVCPATIDQDGPDHDRSWPIRQAATTGGWVIVDDEIEGFGRLSSGPWSEPPRSAVVLPVAQAGQPHPAAILIAGVSSAKPLDEAYRGFSSCWARSGPHDRERTRVRRRAAPCGGARGARSSQNDVLLERQATSFARPSCSYLDL